MECRGEASPLGGSGLEHREVGRWEAVHPRTEGGPRESRLGSGRHAAREQKGVLSPRRGRPHTQPPWSTTACQAPPAPQKEPSWGPGSLHTQGPHPTQAPDQSISVRPEEGPMWSEGSPLHALCSCTPAEVPILGIAGFPAVHPLCMRLAPKYKHVQGRGCPEHRGGGLWVHPALPIFRKN